jgi:hypothetical protein
MVASDRLWIVVTVDPPHGRPIGAAAGQTAQTHGNETLLLQVAMHSRSWPELYCLYIIYLPIHGYSNLHRSILNEN